MQVLETEIPDVKIVIPKVFRDARGYFLETYNKERYEAIGIYADFVQDNVSCSSKGVIRGLHWQAAPYTQAKLVSVIKGAVWDVAVDIRKGSPTFGKYVAVELTAENGRQFYIPRGFAHGFMVLEDNTIFSYKCDNLYCPSAERGLRYDDPMVNIAWPKLNIEPILSEKDLRHLTLKEIEAFDTRN